ncbi:hypothetical protein ACWD5F_09975 [Streptomyces sp. NPDC002499]
MDLNSHFLTYERPLNQTLTGSLSDMLISSMRLGAAALLAFGATLFTTGISVASVQATDQTTSAGIHRVIYPDGSSGYFSTVQSAISAGNARGVSVVTFYDWVNYNSQGDTLTYAVPIDCTPSLRDKDYQYPSLPSSWNDRISSVSTQIGTGTHCDVWFSADQNYEGECGNMWIDKHWDLTQVPYGCYDKASSFELS